MASFANASLVGAKTVNGPGAEIASTRPAFWTSETSVENSGLPDSDLDDRLRRRGRLRQRRRDDDGVDGVDDSVRGLHVGDHHTCRAVEDDLAALEGQRDRLTLDGLDLLPLLGRCERRGGGDPLADDVIREHGPEELLVGGDLVVEGGVALLQIGERLVGRREDGQVARCGERACEARLLHERDEGLELARGDRGLDDVLLARGRRLRGRGRGDRGAGGERRRGENDCCTQLLHVWFLSVCRCDAAGIRTRSRLRLTVTPPARSLRCSGAVLHSLFV